ncbi:hypothetical protein ACFC58_42340 [Kitasatospora purpeofusca]|uniref:hypothetical protein n=1 Tax=Kitasatospora purpeofusca TaxID=67352 RepID=UPI0035DE2289
MGATQAPPPDESARPWKPGPDQPALRHHISLPTSQSDKNTDTNKQVLGHASASAVVVGSLADYLESYYAEEHKR